MPPSVLILGGGYGGAWTARHLPVDIKATIVSDQNFLLFTPMLAEVAAGDVDPRHIATPIRQLAPRAGFVQGSIESIDLANRSVVVRPGFGLDSRTLTGDVLVLALGGVPATFGVPGVEQFAISFKTIGDALRIRNRVLGLLESSAGQTDPHLTSVAVVGAGYSGCEVAASVADFMRAAHHRYFRDAPAPSMTLVDAVDRVAPGLSRRLSQAADRALGKRGVKLELGRRVAAVDPKGITLEDGSTVDAATVIWAAGSRSHPLVADLNLPMEKGRLVVDRQMRAAPNVFALGDAALVPSGESGFSSQTAQFALRQGAWLGKNLTRIVAGEEVPRFEYKTLGELVSLGHRNAVGMIMGIPAAGFLGWFLWRSYYLLRLPGVMRKARVALDWTLDLVFGPDIAWLPTSDLGPDV